METGSKVTRRQTESTASPRKLGQELAVAEFEISKFAVTEIEYLRDKMGVAKTMQINLDDGSYYQLGQVPIDYFSEIVSGNKVGEMKCEFIHFRKNPKSLPLEIEELENVFLAQGTCRTAQPAEFKAIIEKVCKDYKPTTKSDRDFISSLRMTYLKFYQEELSHLPGGLKANTPQLKAAAEFLNETTWMEITKPLQQP